MNSGICSFKRYYLIDILKMFDCIYKTMETQFVDFASLEIHSQNICGTAHPEATDKISPI